MKILILSYSGWLSSVLTPEDLFGCRVIAGRTLTLVSPMATAVSLPSLRTSPHSPAGKFLCNVMIIIACSLRHGPKTLSQHFVIGRWLQQMRLLWDRASDQPRNTLLFHLSIVKIHWVAKNGKICSVLGTRQGQGANHGDDQVSGVWKPLRIEEEGFFLYKTGSHVCSMHTRDSQ